MDDGVHSLPRPLANGLLLRWATPADSDALAEFNFRIHNENSHNPEYFLAHWTRDLMSGNHPTTTAVDFTVVVDSQQRIVSSIGHISQQWQYDGLPFNIGRPELVGTDEAYRRLGLVRQQLALIHQKSAARGEWVQFITGIAWYYRQFGYEMCVPLFGGRRYHFLPSRLAQAQKTEAAYEIRLATEADLPQLQQLYQQHMAGSLLSRVRDTAVWQHEMVHAHRDTPAAHTFYLVYDKQDGRLLGYAEVSQSVFGPYYVLREITAVAGQSLRALGLFVLHYFSLQAAAATPAPIESMLFNINEGHPIYTALAPELSKPHRPYSYYMRVADLPAFLGHIAPVLEKRLADSVMAGYSGQVRLNFARSFYSLQWQNGRLQAISPYQPAKFHDGDAFFPEQTFLQLLFGHRSLADLEYSFTDCSVSTPDTAVLLPILFPPRPSWVMPLF